MTANDNRKMTIEEQTAIISHANRLLEAVMVAMNDDDMANFERYLDLYQATIEKLTSAGIKVSLPLIDFVPGHKTIN
jgi:hypothetical protein